MDTAEQLHELTHSDCVSMHMTMQNEVNQNPSMVKGGGRKAPLPAEALVATEGFWEKESVFFKHDVSEKLFVIQ